MNAYEQSLIISLIFAVLNGWVQCGEVVRADMILNRMEQLSETGQSSICPNVVSYSTVINGYVDYFRACWLATREKRHSDMLAVVSYVRSWWKSKKRDGPARAEQVFKRMVDAYKAGNQAARPNLVSYVNLINAIVRSGDADAAQRAEDALFEMYRQYKDGDSDVKPNARVIALVMECWQKSGKREAGEKAERILTWMLEIYGATKDKDFQPNEYICSLGSLTYSLLTPWTSSHES